jgi:hypothetical protein
MAEQEFRAIMQEGFGSIHRRIDDFIDVSSTRHREVVTKIQEVAGDVRGVDGRVTRIETRVDLIEPRVTAHAAGDAGHVSIGDLKWYLGLAGGAIGGTLAVLRFLGKI